MTTQIWEDAAEAAGKELPLERPYRSRIRPAVDEYQGWPCSLVDIVNGTRIFCFVVRHRISATEPAAHGQRLSLSNNSQSFPGNGYQVKGPGYFIFRMGCHQGAAQTAATGRNSGRADTLYVHTGIKEGC